ncbi:MAG: tRNA (adenosine(37)-N6)-threonylcarbamoyltransferase complex ATPase subunit type 1 TsaE [Planctomycetes bacterium]|jgi:tRNA threonylcarbamoyladenosine biosynthesis protein TsaE|nr:tRNA (adenosine(37)-N6)-threonylcarbamoyltransferase complex ATPase subunit type 1 TsaE [Planctomycetota bacterium]
MSEIELISSEVEDTLSIGREIGLLVPAGTFIALTGELGAGKSHLAKGIAQGLGVDGWAGLRSPTFTLMLTYHGGRCVLHHVDFYRLADSPNLPGEIEEVMHSKSDVCIVEWAQVWRELWPKRHLHVDMQALEDNQRRIVIHDASKLAPKLAAQLAKWAAPKA